MDQLTEDQLHAKINTFLSRKLANYHQEQTKKPKQPFMQLVSKVLVVRLL